MYAINYKTGEVTLTETGQPDLHFRHDETKCNVEPCWTVNGVDYDDPYEAGKVIYGEHPSRWRQNCLTHWAVTWPVGRLAFEGIYHKRNTRTDCLVVIQIQNAEAN